MSGAARLPGVVHFLGVDGGGSATRARLHDAQGRPCGEGRSGPSGLSQGIGQAWRHVRQAIAAAFAQAGLTTAPPHTCALGIGVAGGGRADLRRAFVAEDPGYAALVVDSDATTMLLAAHGARPGVVVAAGTGSVGAARWPDGSVRMAGGWGFPVGDEGGGASLGLAAVAHWQAVLDGRAIGGSLASQVGSIVGLSRAAVGAWCAGAGQQAYALLAPMVFEQAQAGDSHALHLLQRCAAQLAELERALQPQGPELPVVVSGSIGQRLQPLWPADLRQRCIQPQGDGAHGAFLMLRAALAGSPIKGVFSE